MDKIKIVGKAFIIVFLKCFILNNIIVINNNVMFVNIWLFMLNKGYSV